MGDFDSSDGGYLEGIGQKQAILTEVGGTYGVAVYGAGVYGDTGVGAHLTGGGALAATATKAAYAAEVLPGGGSPSGIGSKGGYGTVAITGGGSLDVTGEKSQLYLSGGGHLWGPYPFVLSPGIRIRSAEGRVHIRTGESKVKVRNGSSGVSVLDPLPTVQILIGQSRDRLLTTSVRVPVHS